MIRYEELLQLRELYIEIGKMVQGYGQYNGILRILMGQVNCIDSDKNESEKMNVRYVIYISFILLLYKLNDTFIVKSLFMEEAKVV